MADPSTVADKFEITELLHTYCKGVDRCDAELLRSVYHEDGWDEHGVFSGPGWEFAEWIPPRMRARFDHTAHQLSNIIISVRGDRAVSQCMVTGYHVPTGQDGVQFDVFFGRYLDRLERREGVWKIRHRLCLNDFSTVVRASGEMPSQAQYILGSRNRQDPSFDLDGFLEGADVPAPSAPAKG